MGLNLFERYIAATMLKATVMTLAVLVVLLLFFGLIEELDDLGKGSYTLADAFLVVSLSAPRYLFEVFPVAALLGSLIGLGSMASHGELVAMRGAGFSLSQIVGAVLKAGVLMVLVVFLFGELAAPAAEQWAGSHRMERQQERITLKSRHGFWARDGKAFVNIRDIQPGGRLGDIFIYEFDAQRRLTLVTHADAAEYRVDHWELSGIRQSRIARESVEHRVLQQARWDSLLDPGLLNAILVPPSMLRLDELNRYIRVMRDNEQVPTEYLIAFWGKLSVPLATLVMLFIAIPFVLAHHRFVSVGQRIFLGLMLGMAYYTLSRGLSFAAVVYEFNPMLSALLPAVLFLGAGAYMMRGLR